MCFIKWLLNVKKYSLLEQGLEPRFSYFPESALNGLAGK